MSDDENDEELLALLRQSLGIGPGSANAPPETYILRDAQFICDNSIDVALDMAGTRTAAALIHAKMQDKGYSAEAWREHELHPKMMGKEPEAAVNFIFTMDLLNFCFWSYSGEGERFCVEYPEVQTEEDGEGPRGKRWTGYWSLVAALRRALDDGIPITSPSFWHNEAECTEEVYRKVFRSATAEPMPLFDKRVIVLQEAAEVLCKDFEGSVINLIEQAKHSAAGLVNLLAKHFPCFRDEARFEGKTVRFLKRAQIFVADLWAAFEGEGYGRFDDIDKITIFADYRIPQILHTMGCMLYSPPLERDVRKKIAIKSKSTWEVELRGCSIWCVEMIRREIIQQNPETTVNAVLIDFFLYDTMKEIEAKGEEAIPHHRTRSIWY